MKQRRFADAESLRPVVRAALGPGRAVTDVARLAGGTKKGAYRVVVDDDVTVLVYVWNPAEDFWAGVLPAGADDPLNPFSHASGLDLFEAAARRLTAAGVRCPRVLLADRGRGLYPGDVAVVEYVPGSTLEAVLESDPRAASRPLGVLADWLAAMEACRATGFGKVAVVDAGLSARGGSCAQAVLERALHEVDEICAREARAAGEGGRLSDLLRALAEPLEPRGTSGLVHGELGPDHILLDRDGDPVLIDIEGLLYFDAEWEHVFLRLRFGDRYPRLARPGLDQDRLRFYRLAQHLNLVAGPLRIADSGHPERAWFLELADYHLAQALAFKR
jgi:Phosphotransferase enzyme family